MFKQSVEHVHVVPDEMSLMVNGYTFRGNSSVILSLFLVGSTLKGKNLLLKDQILSFKGRPLFSRALFLGKPTGSHKIVSL